MPQFRTKTLSANKVWSSPDGQRTIFEVVLDYQGQKVKAKTYSKTIATEGFEGDVDVYEKPGRNGSEQFVRQVPKENPGYGSTGGGSPRSGSGYTPKDEKAIQAMWAVGKSVEAHVGAADLDPSDLSSVEAYAVELNAMVGRVKGEDSTDTTAPDKPVEDEVVTDIPDGPIDLSDIDELFPDNEKITPAKEEKPWPPKN